MKSLIFGSSGMVGSHVLQECINNSKITSIMLIGRNNVVTKSKKVKQTIISDLSKIETIENKLKDYQICFYCIGVYQNAVSTDKFIRITYDYFKKISTSKT